MKKSILFVFAIVILVGLSACSLGGNTEPQGEDLELNNQAEAGLIEPGEETPVIEGEEEVFISDSTLGSSSWLWLESLVADEQVFPNQVDAFVVNFDEGEGQVSIQTDCNTNFGSYQADETKLEFGKLASTRMFCDDSQENLFIDQLTQADSYQIDEVGYLRLLLAEDAGYMLFAPYHETQE